MGQYKLSKYVYVDERDDEVFLYNANKIDMCCMSKCRYEQLMYQLEANQLEVEQKSNAYLLEKSYVVKSEIDENRIADYTYIQTCHSNRQMMLTILPTEGCNFRCEYCYEEHKNNVMSESIQESVIKFVRNNIRFYGGLMVSWFGGEPLLYPEVIEKLTCEFKKICKLNKKPYSSVMTTNGYLLDFNMFQRMKKCNVMNYQITLDGLASIHDKQRFLAGGMPTFSTIINNLKDIKEKEKSKLYSFTIRTNLTVKSLKTYPEFAKFLEDTFLDDQRFAQRVRLAWNGSNEESYNENVISNWDVGLLGNGIDINKEVNRLISDIENEGLLRQAFLEQIGTMFPCYAAKSNSFVFGPDGRVFKCTVHFDDDKNGIIGNLSKAGHIDYDEEISVKWVTQASDNHSKCHDCVVYPICQGVGCPYKMSVYGLKEEKCEATRKYIINTYKIYSANKKICCNIQEI